MTELKLLKPCPCCGNKNIGIDYEHQSTKRYCYCERCGIRTDYENYFNEIVSAWDTRPSPWVSVETPPKIYGHYYVSPHDEFADYSPEDDEWISMKEPYGLWPLDNVKYWMEIPKPPNLKD